MKVTTHSVGSKLWYVGGVSKLMLMLDFGPGITLANAAIFNNPHKIVSSSMLDFQVFLTIIN